MARGKRIVGGDLGDIEVLTAEIIIRLHSLCKLLGHAHWSILVYDTNGLLIHQKSAPSKVEDKALRGAIRRNSRGLEIRPQFGTSPEQGK